MTARPSRPSATQPHRGAAPDPALLEQLQPGGSSATGFLAPGEDLERVIAADAAAVAAVGTTHRMLATRLEVLLDRAEACTHDAYRKLERDEHAADDALLAQRAATLAWLGAMPTVGRLRIAFIAHAGHQSCPWGDAGACPAADEPTATLGCCDWALMDTADRYWTRPNLLERLIADRAFSGEPHPVHALPARASVLQGPGLLVHLLRHHRFFEGPGVPYRVEPAQLNRFLDLADT
jgi:hypothetical protein